MEIRTMDKKIQFFTELFNLHECRIQLLDFLIQEKIFTDDEKQRLLIRHKSAHPALIMGLLADKLKKDELQSVEYTWEMLPHHVVKLLIVGNAETLELAGAV